MPNDERFAEHDKWESEMMNVFRKYMTNSHLPDVRIFICNTIFSIDFKTTRNVEKNSHDMYFHLVDSGEKVAICYIPRPGVTAEKLPPLCAWITNLKWEGPFPPSIRSRSGDQYYRIFGGLSVMDFINSIK